MKCRVNGGPAQLLGPARKLNGLMSGYGDVANNYGDASGYKMGDRILCLPFGDRESCPRNRSCPPIL